MKEIPLSELPEFHNHPFQIRSDEELEEMIENFGEKNTVYMHWRRCGERSESVAVSVPE